jgi:hypothetical protein
LNQNADFWHISDTSDFELSASIEESLEGQSLETSTYLVGGKLVKRKNKKLQTKSNKK